MVLGEADVRARSTAEQARERVIWHDLECGSYRADLELWCELAQRAGGAGGGARVLDVGAGTGRVAIALARAGHTVTAVDLDPALLAELDARARSEGLEIAIVRADARTLQLEGGSFDLCVVPMQTIQLLGGPEQRVAFLSRARAHVDAGGIVACAIVTDVEPFDCAAGDIGPSAESARVGDALFVSRAVSVRSSRRRVRIERERSISPVAPGRGAPPRVLPHDVIELDRLSAAQLIREGARAGLRALPQRTIAATEEHVGSVVVVLGA